MWVVRMLLLIVCWCWLLVIRCVWFIARGRSLCSFVVARCSLFGMRRLLCILYCVLMFVVVVGDCCSLCHVVFLGLPSVVCCVLR